MMVEDCCCWSRCSSSNGGVICWSGVSSGMLSFFLVMVWGNTVDIGRKHGDDEDEDHHHGDD
eukprot:scaffold6_cov146-Ochromonas_danica.AAC.1